MNENRRFLADTYTERDDIIHLLKLGRSEEARAMIEQKNREDYPNAFVPFMDEMIREHGISRKNIAVRSGLSQDYVYKLLRGDKHTDERDYILAMCFAIGMNLAQTQHALSSSGMPLLSEQDIRSHVIIMSLRNGDSIDTLNETLEKAGFPLLKVSPDMPSAVITDTCASPEHLGTIDKPYRPRREFEEIDSFTEGHPNSGGAPFDYDYQGWIKLRDADGHTYQIEAVFASESSFFRVFTEQQRQKAELLMTLIDKRESEFYEKNKQALEASGGQLDFLGNPELYMEYLKIHEDIPEAESLEYYESLEEAAGSEFFPYFLELDKRTDKKVQEVMESIDDTRTYGYRVGSGWSGQTARVYIELFNQERPELREYYQIVETQDGICRYTVTHESCFMRMELGPELYQLYFGSKPDPEYILDTDKNEFYGNLSAYQRVFTQMRAILHGQVLNSGILANLTPEELAKEQAESLISRAELLYSKGNARDAVEAALKSVETIEELKDRFPQTYASACYCTALSMQSAQDARSIEWWEKLYALEEVLLTAYQKEPESYEKALSAVAHAAGVLYSAKEEQLTQSERKHYLEDALNLIDRFHTCRDNWVIQFELRGWYAFLIEEEDPERSMTEYRKTLTVARNHHLDQNSYCARAVAVNYNNYAWNLWNRFGSEEAILYYGRAIDLLESYLYSGIVERETVLRDLKHIGSALNRIYIDTSHPKESEHLKERLSESGVNLN